MPVTISARLTPDLAERLRDRASEEDRTVSDLVSRAVDEYLRAARFPGIFFTTGAAGRRKARLAAGPDVWEVVFVAQAYTMDVARTAEHLDLPAASVRLALAYYRAYPEEIDARLRRMQAFDEAPDEQCPVIQPFVVPERWDASDASAA